MSAGDEGEGRWGYSSGGSSEPLDTNDNVLFWVATRIPTSLNHISLPIFGVEARIDINLPLYDTDPPPGPPSWQVIYIPDEDSNFRFVGIRNYPRAASRYGILALLGHWFPRLWLKW